MNLQQFIEAKKAEWRKKFLTPSGFIRAAIKGSFQVTREQHEDFLSTALREAVTQALDAVRVSDKDAPEWATDPEEGAGFNAAVSAQENNINDYLK